MTHDASSTEPVTTDNECREEQECNRRTEVVGGDYVEEDDEEVASRNVTINEMEMEEVPLERGAPLWPNCERPILLREPAWYELPGNEIAKIIVHNAVHLLSPVEIFLEKPYGFEGLRQDLQGALMVFVMLVPQALAYGNVANLPPVYGLYCATIPLYVYFLFGTCPVLGMGPAAILSIMTGLQLDKYPEEDRPQVAGELALLVGIFSLLLTVIQGGIVTRLISRTVISSFTSGAAVHVVLSQLKYFLNVKVKGSETLHEWVQHFIEGCETAEVNSVYTAILTVTLTLMLIFYKKLSFIPPTFPFQLIVVVVMTLLVFLARLDERIDVAIVGDVPSDPPPVVSPNIKHLGSTIGPAIVMAIVGYVENFSVGKKFGEELGFQVSPQREFLALGMCNFLGSMFSSYPVSASLSRSAVTKLAKPRSQFHLAIVATLIMITIVGLSRLYIFYYLPKLSLAAIVVSAALRMIYYEDFLALLQTSKKEATQWALTFLAVLFLGVEIGLAVGVGLSVLRLLANIMSAPIAVVGKQVRSFGRRPRDHHVIFRDATRHDDVELTDGVLICRFDQPLYFINAEKLVEYVRRALFKLSSSDEKEDEEETRAESSNTPSKPECLHVLILDCSGIVTCDYDGAKAMQDVLKLCTDHNVVLFLAGMKRRLKNAIKDIGLYPKKLSDGKEVFPTVLAALHKAETIVLENQQQDDSGQ